MALTDIQVRTAKPKEKDYKLTDGEGMFLLIASSGGNRTAHLVERMKMMQLWADYLDGLKAGAKVIPIMSMAA